MKTSMRYKKLGHCGTQVSQFSLGGWTTFGGSVQDSSFVKKIILTAFEAGVNFFDIADIYSNGASEIEMGKTLQELPRHRLVISSKVFWPMSEEINDRGLSRKHIFESINKSLKRIGTDYLDIYFCHRFDEQTPLEETIRAMDDLVHQGKILYWGTSMWTSDQIKEAFSICKAGNYYKPQVEQPEYNPFVKNRIENDIAKTATDSGMGLVTWSPLASGLLTGKYNDNTPADSRLHQIGWLAEKILTPENLNKARLFSKLADKLGAAPAVLALSWAARKDFVSSVILGASRPEQVNENLKALNFDITAEIEAEIAKIFSSF